MASAVAVPKGILIKAGTPRTNRKNTVNFIEKVDVIGQDKTVPLAAPATTNDELTFEYNPPANTAPAASYGSGKRAGTMRVKGPAVMSQGNKKSVMSIYGASSPAEPTQQRDPAVIEGYLKLLKQTGMKSSWLKRYVRLTNKSLSYYKSEDASKSLKEIEITNECYVREISQKAGVTNCQNALEVSYDRKNSIVLKGSSQKEATEWITSICTVVDALGGIDDDEEFEFIDEDDDEFEFIEESPREQKKPDPFSASISSTSKASDLADDELEWWDEDEELLELPPIEDAKKEEEEKKRKEEKQKQEEATRKEEEERFKREEEERLRREEEARKMSALRRAEEETKKREQESVERRKAEKMKQDEMRLKREAEFKKPPTGSPAVVKTSVFAERSARGNGNPRGGPARGRGASAARGRSDPTEGTASRGRKPTTRVGNLMKMFENP